MIDIHSLIKYVAGFAWRDKARNTDSRIEPGSAPHLDLDSYPYEFGPIEEFPLHYDRVPEKRLCIAMIVRGILDLFSEEHREDALKWLCYRSRYDAFVPKDATDEQCDLAGTYVEMSFPYCCQALDIPSNDVREAILNAYRNRC